MWYRSRHLGRHYRHRCYLQIQEETVSRGLTWHMGQVMKVHLKTGYGMSPWWPSLWLIWFDTRRRFETRWRFKSPASHLFTRPFFQAQIRGNIIAPRYWPLCGELTGDRCIPRTKGQWRRKIFLLMTSSWRWSSPPHARDLMVTSHQRYGVCNHQPLDYFVKSVFRLKIKENIKAPHYWPFDRGIYWRPVESPHKGQ